MVHNIDSDEDAFLGLNPNAKYCLVDTMVLIPLCQGDPDVIRDAKREIGGAVLIVLDIILKEAVRKLGKMAGGKTNRDEFVSILSYWLEPAGISFKVVGFKRKMYSFWKEMREASSHPNLSPEDYALLCTAMKLPDMDIMTDDKGLIGSVGSERGPKARGKTRSVMRNYMKRRGDTAGFIRYKIRKHLSKAIRVKWDYRIRFTKFLVDDVVVASMDHSQGEKVEVDLSSLVKDDTKHADLQSKLGTEIQEFFDQWRPARGGRDLPRGKDWYRQHLDDDDDAWQSRTGTKRRP